MIDGFRVSYFLNYTICMGSLFGTYFFSTLISYRFFQLCLHKSRFANRAELTCIGIVRYLQDSRLCGVLHNRLNTLESIGLPEAFQAPMPWLLAALAQTFIVSAKPTIQGTSF